MVIEKCKTKRFACEVEEELLKKFQKEVRKDYSEGKIRKIIESAMQMFCDYKEIAFPLPEKKKK